MEVLKNRADIINLVQSVAQEQGIQNFAITNVKTNEKGEGYLGQIFLITVTAKDNEKKLDVVIKAAFMDEKIRRMVPIRKCFENEIHFYNTIYPVFKKFEQDRGIFDESELVPKCYKTILESEKELLCLQNLQEQNFEMFEKTTALDHEHVGLIFKIYGRFHAYSFVLKDQKPEEYSNICSKLANIYGEFMANTNGLYQEHLKGLIKQVQPYLTRGEDDEVIEKFEKYNADGVVNFYADTISDTCDRSVILHGDCWSNNMMFKYQISEHGKKLVDMRFLDMQMVKVGSPICDLSYCLYSGASKTVFDNLEEYLKIYHESFSSFVKQLGSDPKKLFSFEALKNDWKKYAKFGFILSLSILKRKATKKEDNLDLLDGIDEDEFLEKASQVKFDEELYKKQIKDLLYHLSAINAL